MTVSVRKANDREHVVHRAVVAFEVRYCEVDMHGHMHNGAYVGHIETAITHLAQSLGPAGAFDPATAPCLFVVKRVDLVFHEPLRFQDQAVATAQVAALGRTSITFEVTVRRQADGVVAATATVVWVAVDRRDRRPIPLPAAVCTGWCAQDTTQPSHEGDGLEQSA